MEEDDGLASVSRTSTTEQRAQPHLPCLLGAPRNSVAPTVKVKNGFIDGFADDEDEDFAAMPRFRKSRTWANPSSDDSSPMAYRDEPVTAMAPLQGELLEKPRAPASRQAMLQEELKAIRDEVPVSVAEPLPLRQPQMSVGSADHDAGVCRPCAWFWRPQGCTNGAECRHCHLCPVGEVKKRRKANRRSSRSSETSTGAATGSSDEGTRSDSEN